LDGDAPTIRVPAAPCTKRGRKAAAAADEAADGLDEGTPTIPAAPRTKRGRKAAAAAEEADDAPLAKRANSLDEDAPTIPAAPRTKRGRKAAAAADETDGAPLAKPPKRAKLQVEQDGPSVEHLPGQPGKKGTTRKKVDTMPRDPLPDRQVRNVHPVPKQAKRRTSKEVAAEQEAKKKEIEETIRAGEIAKQLLAQMNVSEDRLDNDMNAENPRRISGVNRKRAREEIDTDGELFDFQKVDAMLSESDDSEEEPVQKQKALVSDNDIIMIHKCICADVLTCQPKKKAKGAKGELRREVQNMEDAIRGGEDGVYFTLPHTFQVDSTYSRWKP
jgi:hypothetical protein